MKGTIIENSLENKNILKDLCITNTWNEEDCILHDVVVNESEILLIQKALATGPWYVHFWEGDTIVVIYKNKIFRLKKEDKRTWAEAITYGKDLGIPENELNFLTN